ncbi:MAG: hypothetical protein CMQ34_07605 [Gammaproteobacteria bacterium]|nr:hypothetical protein [Gammaproteobacteria bacterium]|tara:strand:+ start:2140 stop:3231 length:1092 start_codon:yes stop_codon:yes gene_type:complete
MTRMTTLFLALWASARSVWLLLMLALWLTPSAQALPVDGLYGQEIVVENQSEAAREGAYREAFERVIVKVTGERRWLEHPRIQEAVPRSSAYVAEVSYRTVGLERRLDVRFDQSLIDELLNRAEIPVWDRNRASILLWVTVQESDGRRTMLGSSSEHALLMQVRDFATERAVPVLIPLLDLTDRRIVTVDQGWALDVDALREAGQRYGADSVLAGRLLITPANEVVGLWQFLFRDQVHVFDHVDSSVATYMEFPLDEVTTRLADHFGLVLSEFEQEDEVLLRIEGISDLSNHTALMRYLASLSVVRDVNVSALRADTVELRVQLAGTRQHLSEFISLGRDLQPVNFEVGAVTSDLLHYRWTRQ